jgi:hypothetical protein
MRVRRFALILRSGSQGGGRDLSPSLESSPQFLLVSGRGKPMSTRTEVLGDGTIGREETLGLARRFEPLHAPFPLAGGLMRLLCPIIERAVLPVFHPWENLSLSRSVALKSIGDDHPWYIRQPFE